MFGTPNNVFVHSPLPEPRITQLRLTPKSLSMGRINGHHTHHFDSCKPFTKSTQHFSAGTLQVRCGLQCSPLYPMHFLNTTVSGQNKTEHCAAQKLSVATFAAVIVSSSSHCGNVKPNRRHSNDVCAVWCQDQICDRHERDKPELFQRFFSKTTKFAWLRCWHPKHLSR